MPFSPNVQSAITRMATEFKTIRALTGALTSLTTTDKTNLVAAINEIKAASLNAGAQINDTIAGTGTVYSSSKTEAHVADRIAALVAGSPALLDTLDEVAAAIGDDPNFAATITTALGNRVRYDAAQTLTAPQQVQARANIGAGTGNSNLVIGTGAGDAKAGNYAPPTSSDTVQGVVELATPAEVLTGTDATRAVTPAGLAGRTATEARVGLVELATGTETATGTDATRAVHPAGLKTVTDTLATKASVGDTEVNLVTLFEAGLV